MEALRRLPQGTPLAIELNMRPLERSSGGYYGQEEVIEVPPQKSRDSRNAATRRILAVASGGGHWVQLRRLLPAMESHDLAYVTTNPGYADEVAPFRFHVVADGARDNKLRLLLMALQMAWIVLRERPDVVISTGAAPGYFALRLGRLLGARTIWVDSIANVDEMSLSGRLAKPYADLWLTQWPHLVSPDGPRYAGAVL